MLALGPKPPPHPNSVDASDLMLRPVSWPGECGVVHAHTASWGVNVREGSTITAVSATLPGTVFEAGEVYGGRPPRKLGASWVA